MTKRALWLVAYDIADPPRLARVLDYLKGWSTGGQKSVHECWLAPAELRLLRSDLGALIAPLEDRLLFVRPDTTRGVRTLGIATRPRNEDFFYFG